MINEINYEYNHKYIYNIFYNIFIIYKFSPRFEDCYIMFGIKPNLPQPSSVFFKIIFIFACDTSNNVGRCTSDKFDKKIVFVITRAATGF